MKLYCLAFKKNNIVNPDRIPTCSKNKYQKPGASGIIKVNSTPPSPFVLEKMKHNSWRFWVDHRHLDNLTIKDKFSISNIDELFDQLYGGRFLQSVDLRINISIKF